MKELNLVDLTDRLLDSSPQKILDEVFSEVNLEDLQAIKQELGLCINWKVLIDRMYHKMMGGMDSLVFIETEDDSPQVVKRSPYEALFERDKAYINGSNEKSRKARKYVLLMLLKKVLGGLKTRVNKEFEKFETINDSTENELQELIRYGFDAPDEEEMDLVSGLEEESEITAGIDHRKSCEHRRVTVKQIPSTKTASRMDELHTFCKDCKSFLELKKLNSRSTGKRSIDHSKPLLCQHRNGHWKEGEEGKIAICSSCDEIVPNPNKFEWLKAGLEPVGDDPDQDVLQHFSTNNKEMVA